MASTDSDVKPLRSAFDSPYFGEDTSFRIDQPIGSMSISPCGRDVVLASKEGLHIIDLDSPYSPPRHLAHHTSWEVADVQWSPFALRDSWIVSTSNQKALVWNVGAKSTQDYIEFVLHGHSRAITDINFSAHHPDVLATCAVDGFVHCWDLRAPNRPVISFSDWFAGATQVKWNRQNSHVVASSHDRYLRIWDDRMGAYPIRSIGAHTTKIYGVDWNRNHENQIVTCSLDKTIKFWNTETPEDVPDRVLETGFPVWRARHTPFGRGLLAMPQRENSDLHLYDRRYESESGGYRDSPVATFPGHRGQVKEFLWRSRGTIENSVDHRDFQLVTWGTDRQLRLHRIEDETLQATGYEKGVTTVQKFIFSRRGAEYKTFRDEPSDESNGTFIHLPGQSFQMRSQNGSGVGMRKVNFPVRGWMQSQGLRIGMHGRSILRQDMNPIAWMKNVKISSEDLEALSDEITQVSDKFTKVSFDMVDIQQRKAAIALHGPWGNENVPVYLKVDIKFPRDYPRAASPHFTVQKTASMTDELSKRLLTDIKVIAEAYVKVQRGCVEAVLRYLLREQDVNEILAIVQREDFDPDKLSGSALIEDVSSDEDDEDVGNFQGQAGLTSSEILNQNVLVPVAKGCGALWAENGQLVCFFPARSKEPRSFFDALGLNDAERPSSDKIFEGFGRFHTSSPGPKGTVGTTITNDDAASESSTGYLSSSSSSSSSSASGDDAQQLLSHPWGTVGLRHSRSHENSQKSTNGLSASKTTLPTAKSLVSLHNMTDLLPVKRELAREYKVFGHGPDVCAHNAEVAIRHDNLPLAQVWHLVKLMLSDEVPYETIHQADSGASINLIARSTWSTLNRKDSGVDLRADVEKDSGEARRARLRWGGHAFGGQWLVPRLFAHFEARADVQMLAMLACILHEPIYDAVKPGSASDLVRSQSLLTIPTLSVDYFPSHEVAQSILGQQSHHLTQLMSLGTPLSANPTANPSFSSSVELAPMEAPSASASSTPPSGHSAAMDQLRRSSRRSFDSRERDRVPLARQTTTLSTSPEGMRLSRRTNSSLAPSQSRVSMHTQNQTYSSSPAVAALEVTKRSSPSSSFVSQPTTAVSGASGWGSPMFPGGIPTKRSQVSGNVALDSQYGLFHSTTPSMLSQSVSDADLGRKPISRGLSFLTQKSSPSKSTQSSITKVVGGKTSRRRVRFNLTLQNQNLFDNDGYAFVPLLDPFQVARYKSYRSQYANILSVWGFHIKKCEILKFDGMDSYYDEPWGRIRASDASDATASHRNGLQKHVGNSDALAPQGLLAATSTQHRRSGDSYATSLETAGLDLRNHCIRCGDPMTAVQKGGAAVSWSCPSCPIDARISGKRLFCSICEEAITGSMVPCLHCGHVTCFSCAEYWFSESNDHGAESSSVCPSGCGCICSQSQLASVPWPAGADDDARSDTATEVMSVTPSVNTSSLGTLTEDSRESVVGPEEEGWEDESEDESLTDDAIWGNSNIASLGRGLGGGLSRGLQSQASQETIRRADSLNTMRS